MNINKVVLTGRITADPELKYIPGSETAVCNFNIAVNRKPVKDKETADFFRVVTWGKVAEAVSKYMKKGREIAVSGRLQSHSYENKNGDKRVTVEITADEIEFLGSNKNEETKNDSKNVNEFHNQPSLANDNDFHELSDDVDIPF